MALAVLSRRRSRLVEAGHGHLGQRAGDQLAEQRPIGGRGDGHAAAHADERALAQEAEQLEDVARVAGRALEHEAEESLVDFVGVQLVGDEGRGALLGQRQQLELSVHRPSHHAHDRLGAVGAHEEAAAPLEDAARPRHQLEGEAVGLVKILEDVERRLSVEPALDHRGDGVEQPLPGVGVGEVEGGLVGPVGPEHRLQEVDHILELVAEIEAEEAARDAVTALVGRVLRGEPEEAREHRRHRSERLIARGQPAAAEHADAASLGPLVDERAEQRALAAARGAAHADGRAPIVLHRAVDGVGEHVEGALAAGVEALVVARAQVVRATLGGGVHDEALSPPVSRR
jgi:hypothetical protein